jgi:hypothetical protein
MPAEVIKLKKGLNRFGRSSGNDFQIFHESVSRFHCEIELTDDGMIVRDMDSSNGTFINDQPIGEAALETGHVLRMGEVRMEVKDAPDAASEKDMIPCVNHPKLAASMVCTQCGKKFCGSCVHLLKRLNGQFLRLCPVCSGHCDPLHAPDAPKRNIVTSLMTRLLKRKQVEPTSGKGYSK